MKDKILRWLASGRTGLSSKTMAFAALDMHQDDQWGIWHPLDPDDFNRCLILVTRVPEIKEHFDKIAKLSPAWKSIIKNWDTLEKCFIDEVGFDWCKGHRAAKTYDLMKKMGC